MSGRGAAHEREGWMLSLPRPSPILTLRRDAPVAAAGGVGAGCTVGGGTDPGAGAGTGARLAADRVCWLASSA